MGRAPGSTANRICAILKLLSGHADGLGVREISRRMDLPASTVNTLLLSMQEEGLLQQNPYELYQLGPEMLQMGITTLSRLDVRTTALPLMRTLAETSGTACTLNLWNGREVVCVELVEAPNGIAWTAKVGKSYPLTSGAVGKSILAFLPERKEILSAIGRPETVQNSLAESLQLIRENGVAVSVGEKCPGGLAIAAPIWNRVGRVLANLALIGPVAQFNEGNILQLSLALREAANAISLKLGAQQAWLEPYSSHRDSPDEEQHQRLVEALRHDDLFDETALVTVTQ